MTAPRPLASCLLGIALGVLAACGSPSTVPKSAGSAPAVETLQIEEIKPGSGAAIAAGQKAVVNYTGWLYDTSASDNKGKEFDSSRNTGAPFRFTVGAGQVIKGWDQGVARHEGRRGKRRLIIPPDSPTATAAPAASFHPARPWSSTWISSASNDRRLRLRSSACRFKGPQAAARRLPRIPDIAGDAYAVLCHPHPLHGGTMDNKVVYTLGARLAGNRAFPPCASISAAWDRAPERYDGAAARPRMRGVAASYGALRWPGRRLMLAGFSFGAFVALRLALERGASRLIMVAPPVDRMDFSALGHANCPWLVVQGDSGRGGGPAARVRLGERAASPGPSWSSCPGSGTSFTGTCRVAASA